MSVANLTLIVLASSLAAAVLSQDMDDSLGTDGAGRMFIEFGVSAVPWSGNRLCDDPRFMNAAGRVDSRMSSPPAPDALFQDADDCRAAFEARHIVPRMEFGDVHFTRDSQYTRVGGSQFLHTGDCDDPRLEGPGIGDETVTLAERDAPFPLACRIPFLSGAVTLKAKTGSGPFVEGYDGGNFTFDGECDDPRFEGAGMASSTIRLNVGRDATDCASSSVKPTETLPQNSIDFGNNASRFSYDGECDDPRFEGVGMAETLSRVNEMRDAIDCFRAHGAGTISFIERE